MPGYEEPVAETIVLAGLIRNQDTFYELDGKFIKSNDFFHSEHSKIYDLLRHIIVEIQPERVDEYTCLAAASSLGMKLNRTEKEALEVVLARQVGKEALVEAAKTVKRASVKRYMEHILNEEMKQVETATGTISSIIGGIEGRLYQAFNSIGTEEDKIVNLADKMEPFIKSLVNSEPIGLDLGFKQWEEDIGKIRNGSVHGIFARMKQGKSQLALQLAIRSAVFRKVPTLILDTELGEELQLVRMAAQLAKVPYKYVEEGTWVNNPQMVKSMDDAMKKVKDAPIFYAHIPGETIEEAVTYIRKFALKYNRQDGSKTPKTLVIYDYIKLPDISALNNAKEYQVLGAITSRLHDEAQRLKLPIIVVGQQNRSGAEEDKVETIADSDKIARDIDSVTLIRWKTERELDLDSSDNGSHVLKIAVARSGPGHHGGEYINLYFDMSCGFMTEGEKFSYNKLQFLRKQAQAETPEV